MIVKISAITASSKVKKAYLSRRDKNGQPLSYLFPIMGHISFIIVGNFM